MNDDRRFPLSYANVVSTLALFVALGGTAVATGVIDGKKIKRGSVTGKQIRAKSVPGSDLRPNSVRGAQVRESTLAPVPRAIRAGQADVAVQAEVASRADSAGQALTAALASVANQLTPDAAAALTDRCKVGTEPYAGSCFEVTFRPAATWPVAAKVCGDAGGRLPELSELEGFRQRPGISLASSSEHTSTYLDVNGLESGGQFTLGISDGGNLSPGFSYGSSNGNYRCVFPATNR